MENADLVIRAKQLVCVDLVGLGRPKTKDELDKLDIIENGSMIVKNGKIIWLGPQVEEPKIECIGKIPELISCSVATPGLIDSHTHLVFAGSRVREFEDKISGLSYKETHNKNADSGINFTVRKTREASKEFLISKGLKDLDIMLCHGTTTAEIKSGYGLDKENEIKILEVIRELKKRHKIDIVSTFLGAHVVPSEYKEKRNEYVNLVMNMLSEIKERGLAEFCDVFCDKLGFSFDETAAILDRAKELGFKLKLHAEQTGNLEGAFLGATSGAISIDHLDYISEFGIKHLGASKIVGVLLPGVTYHLMEFQKKYFWPRKIQNMIKAGVPLALATDYNPGTCPTQSMQTIMELAARIYKMTPAQIINAATINAAWAIGRGNQIGSIVLGKKADIAIFDCEDWRDIVNNFGVNKISMVIKNGKVVVNRR